MVCIDEPVVREPVMTETRWNDPVLQQDALPQPYRYINELVQSIVDGAVQVVRDKKERERCADIVDVNVMPEVEPSIGNIADIEGVIIGQYQLIREESTLMFYATDRGYLYIGEASDRFRALASIKVIDDERGESHVLGDRAGVSSSNRSKGGSIGTGGGMHASKSGTKKKSQKKTTKKDKDKEKKVLVGPGEKHGCVDDGVSHDEQGSSSEPSTSACPIRGVCVIELNEEVFVPSMPGRLTPSLRGGKTGSTSSVSSSMSVATAYSSRGRQPPRVGAGMRQSGQEQHVAVVDDDIDVFRVCMWTDTSITVMDVNIGMTPTEASAWTYSKRLVLPLPQWTYSAALASGEVGNACYGTDQATLDGESEDGFEVCPRFASVECSGEGLFLGGDEHQNALAPARSSQACGLVQWGPAVPFRLRSARGVNLPALPDDSLDALPVPLAHFLAASTSKIRALINH